MHTPRKRFGQNFLIDDGIIHAIVNAIHPQATDTVVEIGPGLGALTRPLLERIPHLHAIELDRDKDAIYQRFVYVLKEKFHFSHFVLYEVDKTTKERKLIHITDHKSFCLPAADANAMDCPGATFNAEKAIRANVSTSAWARLGK